MKTTFLTLLVLFALAAHLPAAALKGRVTDAATGQPLPSRIYIQRDNGQWFFPTSESPFGSAIPYKKQNAGNSRSVEMHTTLSAHPFVVELPPGRYTMTAERGKEYKTLTRVVEVADEPLEIQLPLERWIDMASHGWYSGDTHVHRTLDELPTLLLAEDLNVALPLTYWVTRAFEPPSRGDKNTAAPDTSDLIKVDPTHVIHPRNTEYEIFTVGGKRHTLGAVFVLNHKSVFQMGAPPVRPIAEQARREGALLDLDKHNWPWSLMLVPIMGVDLFELSNNHIWRTEFAFTKWATGAPAWMNVEYDGQQGTENGWTHFGFQTYYTLLNCGFRLRPSAGTASGVHPVPLGFGRVYVHLPNGFDYDEWMKGLNAGRSFVTTGPMLTVKVNERDPGSVIKAAKGRPAVLSISGQIMSEQPLDRIEIVKNGEIVRTPKPANLGTASGAFKSNFEVKLPMDGSGWIAVRCFEPREGNRFRFAHSSPVHVEIPDKPLLPRRDQVEWLVQSLEAELKRNEGVLPEDALQEYVDGINIFKQKLNP